MASGQEDLGTDAGIEIENIASVSFVVDGVTQNVPATGDYKFKVDRKVDVVVANVSGATVIPEAERQVLTFTVTNKTNDTMDFVLSVEELAEEGVLGEVEIWIDLDGSGSIESAVQLDYIDDLSEDESITVWVIANIPDANEVSDGDTIDVALIAQAVDPSGDADNPGEPLEESPDADDPNEVENVFADGAGADVPGNLDEIQDGKHSDRGTYTVGTANVSVMKVMAVICENAPGGECDGSTPNFSDEGALKPIPGALIQYCIRVSNSGSTAAEGVVIKDPIDTEKLTWVADSIRISPTATCDWEDGEDADGEYDTAQPDDDDDQGAGDVANFDESEEDTVWATVESLEDEESFAVMFRVTIK